MLALLFHECLLCVTFWPSLTIVQPPSSNKSPVVDEHPGPPAMSAMVVKVFSEADLPFSHKTRGSLLGLDRDSSNQKKRCLVSEISR